MRLAFLVFILVFATSMAAPQLESPKPKSLKVVSLSEAYEQAIASKKPLVYWVNCKPSDSPETEKLYETLRANSIHFLIERANLKGGPFIGFSGSENTAYFLWPEKVDGKTADKIKEKWGVPTNSRPGAIIIEEIE